MTRHDFARVGFVLLGAWLALQALDSPPYWIPFSQREPSLLGAQVLLIVLGALVVLWSGRLAELTLRGGARPAGASAPLRLEDLVATGLGLLGLSLVLWNLPAALVSLHEFPSRWRASREGQALVETPSGWLVQAFLARVVSVLLGTALLLAARALARAWCRRFDAELSASSVQSETQPIRSRLEVHQLQAAALAVLGLYIVAQTLPELAVHALEFDFRSPFEWTLEERLPYGNFPTLLAELLRIAVGLGLFFGARRLALSWQRLRSSSGAA